jgi:uncharacterized membrane protein
MTQSAAALSIAGQPRPRRVLQLPSSPGARRATVLIGIGVAASSVVIVIDTLRGFHPHAPRLAMLLVVPATLQVHIAAAVSALSIGFALMVGVKGRAFHRVAGWMWVASMVTVAVSSFWIRDHGRLSYIHFLSGWVSISVPMAVAAVKRRDVKRHRALMTNIFMGGLIVAGAFTFVPGRLMWRIFVG